MASCEFNYLRDFRFRDLVGENAADTHAVTMDMEHDLDGFLAGFVEEFFQDVHDELHWREVVVKQENLVEARLLGLWPCFCDDSGPGAVSSLPSAVARVSHSETIGRLA